MKKLFLIGLLSVFCLSLLGCGAKNNELDTESDVISTSGNIIAQESTNDILNDEKLLAIHPELRDGSVVLGDMLQTNYINSSDTIYYDPYRGIALKLGKEFDKGLIREISTDEGGTPRSEIIFLVKGDENEENRTGINGYREMFTIAAISKENLENFGASLHDLPFKYAPIGENNQYYFVETNVQGTYSDLVIFDVEDY